MPSTSRSAYDLALAAGQLVDPGPDTVGEFTRLGAALGRLDPLLRRIRPAAGGVEPGRIDRGDRDGTLRFSRAPVVRARFTRMRNSHVFSDERPSKPPRPRSVASQVSCTTSSAIAWLGTNETASRSIGS